MSRAQEGGRPNWFGMLWAWPCTAVGISVGVWGLITGGRARRRGCLLEFHGGALPHLLRSVPIPGGAAAMTLGHVVLGRNAKVLDDCRPHELVHVRQYERWGAFLFPAYLGCSGWLWLQSRDPYRDNPFEQEAFQLARRTHGPLPMDAIGETARTDI